MGRVCSFGVALNKYDETYCHQLAFVLFFSCLFWGHIWWCLGAIPGSALYIQLSNLGWPEVAVRKCLTSCSIHLVTCCLFLPKSGGAQEWDQCRVISNGFHTFYQIGGNHLQMINRKYVRKLGLATTFDFSQLTQMLGSSVSASHSQAKPYCFSLSPYTPLNVPHLQLPLNSS